MSLSNEAETAFLNLLFCNIDWANIGDAAGLQNSATEGYFYISLHSSDPAESNDQTTNEIAYTGYGRVQIARNNTVWTVSGNNCSNTSAVTFGQCTGGSASATHFGVGTDSTGSGHLVASGALSATLNISNGITPKFNANDLDIFAE